MDIAALMNSTPNTAGQLLPGIAWALGILVIAGLVVTGARRLSSKALAASTLDERLMAFALTLGAVAVVVALSFGLGGREAAGKQMEYWLANIRD